jgi:DNA-binding NarL/FixJ family response regulator
MSCDRTPKNVLVIEPESLTRLGIATVVSLHPLLRVCGEAANARAARQLSVERSPDLIVLEIVLPNGDGLELLVEFSRILPKAALVVISQCADSLSVQRLFGRAPKLTLAKWKNRLNCLPLWNP